jgi:hypothetical protein
MASSFARDGAPRTAVALIPLALILAGCRGPSHSRLGSFTPPALPAGFADQAGIGWRAAVPSTWAAAAQKDASVWTAVDPQTADEFHAKASVVTEPFTAESYDYASANAASLRRDPRGTLEGSREDVVDGDPTLVLVAYWKAVPPSNIPYRTMQTALASHGTGYVITCAASASAFERYRSTCETIIHSFAVER